MDRSRNLVGSLPLSSLKKPDDFDETAQMIASIALDKKDENTLDLLEQGGD